MIMLKCALFGFLMEIDYKVITDEKMPKFSFAKGVLALLLYQYREEFNF